MLKNLLLKSILYINFVIVFIPSYGQSSFKYMVKLEEVREPGFYQINLSPAVIAKLQPELQDLRLLDANGRQVPYLLQSSKEDEISQRTLIDLPIISKRIEADKQTHVVVKNISGALINNLVLLVKNTDATRVITISGSDNLNEWYIIKENVLLNDLYDDTADAFAEELLFPKSRYKYFKIIIQGKEILPVNIIRVSQANHTTRGSSNYVSIPSPAIFQKDSSDGFSYIRLHFNDFYWINRLSLQVEGRKFFKRRLDIFDNNRLGNGQAAYSLSSGKPMVYPIEHKTNHLLLKIQNDDNPPLTLTGVDAYQLQRSLITWLETGSNYAVSFGDSLAQAPHYDLAFFKDSIRNEPVLLSYGQIERNNIDIKKGLEKFGLHKAWIWVIIIAILLILLFFTFRMTREINKNS